MLRNHKIFDLSGDGNVLELDFSDEEMGELFESEELQELLNNSELYEDREEFNEPENISNNNNFNISDKRSIKWDTAPFCSPDLKLKDLEEIYYPLKCLLFQIIAISI
jgi:hypothetical protein